MRVSPKKRAANRRNALKSTGPKTASGRRTSSQNSIRHGLSVPLPAPLVEPIQQQLLQLIMSDGCDQETAYTLAAKIVEYERNIMYLLNIFKKNAILPSDLDKRRGAISRHHDKDRGPADILADIERHEVHVEDRELRKDLTTLKSICRVLIRSEERNEANKITDSRRYFKRASNQLIKALRRL